MLAMQCLDSPKAAELLQQPGNGCYSQRSVRQVSLHHAGHLLRLRDGNGKPLSRERLIEEFSIFFVAGSETTGHTVAWTL